jgi:hypothetical protein
MMLGQPEEALAANGRLAAALFAACGGRNAAVARLARQLLRGRVEVRLAGD